MDETKNNTLRRIFLLLFNKFFVNRDKQKIACIRENNVMAMQRRKWLGWQDLNLRMTGSKPVALPLGDIPAMCSQSKTFQTLNIIA